MKINFICFKFSKVIFPTICIILIIIISISIQAERHSQNNEIKCQTLHASEEEKKINTVEINSISPKSSLHSSKQIEKKSRQMPEKLKGFKIIGKIEIPKLNLEKYILQESNQKALEVSVTKLCGPQINKIGNFCIAGHNYNKVFGKIKTLEKNDQIILTDVYGSRTVYQVYDNYKTSPKDISCLTQDTGGEKEVTLITCTMGATKRVIIKAVEVYD